jgi:hypothetical protein
MDLQPFVGPWPLLSFLILYTVGRTPWTGDQPFARPLSIHRTKQTQNKRTQSSMPWAGFEPTTPVFMPQTARPLWSAGPHQHLYIPEYALELLMNDRISPLVKQAIRPNRQIFFSTRSLDGYYSNRLPRHIKSNSTRTYCITVQRVFTHILLRLVATFCLGWTYILAM